MSTPEKELENRILDYLNSIKSCFAIKINTVGIYDAKKRTYRKNNNPHIHKGTADILGQYKGRFFAIEVKAGYNKPSEHQKKFLGKIKENGGVAFWTNDFEKFKAAFIKYFPEREFEEKPIFEENL